MDVRAILLLMTLAGCAPRVVEVPIPVMCFKPEQLPVEVQSAKERLTIDAPDGEKIKQILIEREQLRQNDTEFRALFYGCVL